MIDNHEIAKHCNDLIKVANEHRDIFGTVIPGLTGIIGELYAAIYLEIHLTDTQNTMCYDAIDEEGVKYQIKSATPRRLKTDRELWQYCRVTEKHSWDRLIFIMLSSYYELIAIYEVERDILKLRTEASIKHNVISSGFIIEHGILIYSDNKLEDKFR